MVRGGGRVTHGSTRCVARCRSTGQSLEGLDSLNLALQAGAQSDTDWAVFQYQGNTYIYGDKPSLLNGAVNQLDDSDLLVKLTGTIDLDLLVSSLNHVPE